MHHFASRGMWKIAMVFAALVGVDTRRPKRKRRWYAKELTPHDLEIQAAYRKIMEQLKNEEQSSTHT